MGTSTLRQRLDGPAVAPAMTMAKAKALGYTISRQLRCREQNRIRYHWKVTRDPGRGSAGPAYFPTSADALAAIAAAEGGQS